MWLCEGSKTAGFHVGVKPLTNLIFEKILQTTEKNSLIPWCSMFTNINIQLVLLHLGETDVLKPVSSKLQLKGMHFSFFKVQNKLGTNGRCNGQEV